MCKKIVFFAGTKGGVGKSTAALFMAGAAADLDKKFIAFDCDNENPTLTRFMEKHHKDKVVAIDPTKTEFALDQIVDTIENSDNELFIVDMKAGTTTNTLNWLQEFPFEHCQEEGIKFYVAGCLTSDPDSLKTFYKWTAALADEKLSYVVIFNEKDGECSTYKENIADILDYHQHITIRKIPNIYMQKLNQENASLRDVVNGTTVINTREFQGLMPRKRLQNYYKEISEPFKAVLMS